MDKKRKRFLAILLIIVLVFTMNIGVKAVEAAGVYGDGSSISTDYHCKTIFGDPYEEGNIMYTLRVYVFNPVKIIVPVLFLVLTTFDFAKVVFTDDKEAMNKAKKNLPRRALIAVFIFFIPDVLTLIFSLFDSIRIQECLDGFK